MRETLLWIGMACMLGGVATFTAMRQRARREGWPLFNITITVSTIAALAYLAMALGGGIVQVGGHSVYLARYADWLCTTPLLLLNLVLLAIPEREGRAAVLPLLLGADVVMILTGAAASLTTSGLRFAIFAIGAACYAVVLWALAGRVYREARRRDAQLTHIYKRTATITLVLWSAYPLVWLLGAEGTGLLGATAELGIYMVLDVCAKVGYGFSLLGNRLFLAGRRQVFDDAIRQSRARA